ncbi:MAG: putative General secretion pathway protein GspG [Candidatus Berkelbacteria bacterium]|nr:putative General secretion pathway protein GspG [Candidatus Berkelbacteria bacterium]
MNKSRGFTLIEMLVVVFIISLLASIVIVTVNRSRVEAKDAKRKTDLATIKTAVELYRDRFGTYDITFNTGTPPYPSSGYNSPSRGWFNYECGAGCANYKYSIAHGLESWGFLNPAPVDPVHNGPPSWAAGDYEYMLYTDGNKYSIYTRLENPNCTPVGDCWDNSSSSGTYASVGPTSAYEMNYRVGNGY